MLWVTVNADADVRRIWAVNQYLLARRLGLNRVVSEVLSAIVPRVFSDAGERVSFPETGDPYEAARVKLAHAIAAAGQPGRLTRPVLFDTPEADSILSGMQIFPADNPWNEDISNRPVHPDSAAIIRSIGADKPLGYNLDMNFVLVPPDQPGVPVRVTMYPAESDPGLLGYRQTWSFIVAKFMTDPVWWFFLIWLPDFFKKTYGLNIKTSWVHIIIIYSIVTVLSIFGGWITGNLVKSGWSVTRARKTGMFVFALCVVPMLVATNLGVWPAVFLIALPSAGRFPGRHPSAGRAVPRAGAGG